MLLLAAFAATPDLAAQERPAPDPSTVLWFDHPAAQWRDALPVGNGRLGAMVFGGTPEERIQLSEETCWSGGPYDQTRPGGAVHLPDVQRAIFAGRFQEAHEQFGRWLMGYPVEQQKYQSLGNLILRFAGTGEVGDYRHELDLDRAIVTTSYSADGVSYRREVFASAPDQVIVVRITADQPQSVTFTASLRGVRNQAHSNYATDYFQMDGRGDDALVLTGKSADYLGVPGALRYEARVRAVATGGRVRVVGRELRVEGADAVTLYIPAATSFVDYATVGADPAARVDAVLDALARRDAATLLAAHVADHQRLFRRATLHLGTSKESLLPTDQRLRRYEVDSDPALAALLFQFGRYVLIASSRRGTQPANLQGLWNDDQNPPWDSKYTTNINTEMNYWPAEVGNLSDCAEPLFLMIRELTVQGSHVARQHYGASGWVFHQNTDLWRVAAPMDGPDWGTFTTGGAWLCTHLWEHWQFSGDREFLARSYPVMRGACEFFLDFLIEDPRTGHLVTCPSTSPENFPGRAGNDPFFDEVTGSVSPGTTICAGSTIDMQLLRDLFDATAEAADVLGLDASFRDQVRAARARLAPMKVGADGSLQEWQEDWPQKERSHRHISPLYGLYPSSQISPRTTPELAQACRAVLEQRGLDGNGWSSAWKTACWARLREPAQAMAHLRHYARTYTTDSLFALCSNQLQVDGSCGISAAIAELLLQSQDGVLDLLPALPEGWATGEVLGLCARGAFELDFTWRDRVLQRVEVRSRIGTPCRLRLPQGLRVVAEPDGMEQSDDEVRFATAANARYVLELAR